MIEHPVLFDVIVIGAGQAGLSAAYYLMRESSKSHLNFLVLDDEMGPGGAWQHRWNSLTLENVNGIHDLPGLGISDLLEIHDAKIQSNEIIPDYYSAYEKALKLPVLRPQKVLKVVSKEDYFEVTTEDLIYKTKGLINATGTWKNPYIPYYKGIEDFKGIQLHTAHYKNAEEFRGKHVVIVGAGISALQMLGEVSKVTKTTWVTRREPDFRKVEFSEELGRQAVGLVDERVRKGLPPESVVSVTGIPYTAATREMMEKGILKRLPMFDEITENSIKWNNGDEIEVDVIFWNTGFKHSLHHLKDLDLLNEHGGIVMNGRLATQVKNNPRIHLVGYGPSASTIGANRAGRAAVQELLKTLRA